MYVRSSLRGTSERQLSVFEAIRVAVRERGRGRENGEMKRVEGGLRHHSPIGQGAGDCGLLTIDVERRACSCEHSIGDAGGE